MTKRFQLLLTVALGLLMLACKPSKTKSEDTANPVNQGEKQCMEAIIALDDSLGKVRNQACKTISLSETIKQYTKAMEKLDCRNCPEAFTTAFKKHREAWWDMLAVTDKYPDLRGELHDLFKEIEAAATALAPLLKKVRDTWTEVENAMKK